MQPLKPSSFKIRMLLHNYLADFMRKMGRKERKLVVLKCYRFIYGHLKIIKSKHFELHFILHRNDFITVKHMYRIFMLSC